LKKFLAKHPASSLFEMQAVLFDVVRYYNEVRPHRACGRRTPRVTYEGRDKMPAGTLIDQPHHRIRFDVVDVRGHVTLRYLGKLRHLNVGWGYRGQPIRLYVVDDHVDIVTEDGELVGEITLNPNRDYQPLIRKHST
jgi:hypothetical protein